MWIHSESLLEAKQKCLLCFLFHRTFPKPNSSLQPEPLQVRWVTFIYLFSYRVTCQVVANIRAVRCWSWRVESRRPGQCKGVSVVSPVHTVPAVDPRLTWEAKGRLSGPGSQKRYPVTNCWKSAAGTRMHCGRKASQQGRCEADVLLGTWIAVMWIMLWASPLNGNSIAWWQRPPFVGLCILA